MSFNVKKSTFGKELKHKPFVPKCRANNILEVETQALFFF